MNAKVWSELASYIHLIKQNYFVFVFAFADNMFYALIITYTKQFDKLT